jgi:hypothetical protein
MIINVNLSSRKVPITRQILMKLDFLNTFFKNKQISYFMTIHPVAAKLFHVDRWTDGHTHMTKLTVALLYFANVPNKESNTTCG